jgi:hypothetical protein
VTEVLGGAVEVAEGFADVISVGAKAGKVLGKLKALGPALGAAGFAIGLVGMFMGGPSEHDQVMEKLGKILDKVDGLEKTVKSEFTALASLLKTQACLGQMWAAEAKILQAARRMKDIAQYRGSSASQKLKKR